MLKYPLIALINCLLITAVMAKGRDTIKHYFKNTVNGYNADADSKDYDFYRLLLPPDSGEVQYNIREFYKNGTLRYAGKCENPDGTANFGSKMYLAGDAIGFYPSGKRQYVAHYYHGHKQGAFYQYYPNGKLYVVTRNGPERYADSLCQCYDRNGILICNNGKGSWVKYDDDFKQITGQGTVKNYMQDGSWTGALLIGGDSVKYEELYANGVFKSAKSIDARGHEFSFREEEVPANFRGTGMNFIDMFRNRIQWPRDSTGKKLKVNLDTLHISFIVEKDGSLTDYKIYEKLDSSMASALHEAFLKCPKGWTPHKKYGIPVRSRQIAEVKRYEGFVGQLYNRVEAFREEILEE